MNCRLKMHWRAHQLRLLASKLRRQQKRWQIGAEQRRPNKRSIGGLNKECTLMIRERFEEIDRRYFSRCASPMDIEEECLYESFIPCWRLWSAEDISSSIRTVNSSWAVTIVATRLKICANSPIIFWTVSTAWNREICDDEPNSYLGTSWVISRLSWCKCL